jgi:G3E family GTPase
MSDADKVPVTVLTGFLGSGKTTLLNRILSENHGQRIAVIENEFGEIGVDQELVINAEEEVFEMNNGCICCTVRGDLIRILGNLMRRRDRFDRIVVETTGMANPGPVAQTFFVDEDTKEQFALDGIVTMVDAKHFAQQIVDNEEAREQIAFADVIVVNKTDLIDEPALAELERRIRAMNALARIVRSDPATRAGVPISAVLGIGGFDLSRALEHKPTFLEPEYPFEWAGRFELVAGAHTLLLQPGPDPTMALALFQADHGTPDRSAAAERAFRWFSQDVEPVATGGEIRPGEGLVILDLATEGPSRFTLQVDRPGTYWLITQHLPEEFATELSAPAGSRSIATDAGAFAASHTHDDEVGSISLDTDQPLDARRFLDWLGRELQVQGTRIYRLKGFLNFKGVDDRIVIQGVHMLTDTTSLGPWGDRPRRTQLVFIGRLLDQQALIDGFESCLAS